MAQVGGGCTHLRDPLGIDRWHAGVEGISVELAVHKPREEDERVALFWLHLDLETLEAGGAALGGRIEVHEDGRDALSARRAEGAPRVSVRVDAVIVFDVALGARIARDLGELHVAVWLVGELLDLLEHDRARVDLLGEVAREGCAPLGRLRAGGSVGLRALQHGAGGSDEGSAFLVVKKVLDNVYRGRLVDARQA